MKLTKPVDWRSYQFPFIYVQVDAALLDHQNWRLCAMRALGKRDFDALTGDYHERDDPLLIEYILRNILPRRGIHARAEQVLITMGAQNGFWLAAQVLLAKGRVLCDPVIGPQNYYRLAYCSIAAARIAEGIGLIARAVAETGLKQAFRLALPPQSGLLRTR